MEDDKSALELACRDLGIVGFDSAYQRTLSEAQSYAKLGANVVLSGATGTGKMTLARLIHQLSLFNDSVCEVVDCMCGEDLVERELIGGDFRCGASVEQIESKLGDGRRKTLILRQPQELPMRVQEAMAASLGRGETKNGRSFDKFLLISAVTGSVDEMVKRGQLSPQLRFRLGPSLLVPTLAERSYTIPELANHFLGNWNRQNGKDLVFDAPALRRLKNYRWSANLAELKQVVETSAMMTRGAEVTIRAKAIALDPVKSTELSDETRLEVGFDFDEFLVKAKRKYVRKAMMQSSCKKAAAARLLGWSPQRLGNYLGQNDDLMDELRGIE